MTDCPANSPGRRGPFAVTLLLVSVLGVAAVQAQNPDPGPAAELEGLVRDLVDGARTGNTALLDEAICTDWLAAARMLAMARRGRVDPAAAGVLDTFVAGHRDGAVAQLSQASAGGALESVDTQRVTTVAQGESESGEAITVLGADGNEVQYPITGAGVVGVRFHGRTRAMDLSVLRIGEYWCLHPE
jgi:hypothetical protein